MEILKKPNHSTRCEVGCRLMFVWSWFRSDLCANKVSSIELMRKHLSEKEEKTLIHQILASLTGSLKRIIINNHTNWWIMSILFGLPSRQSSTEINDCFCISVTCWRLKSRSPLMMEVKWCWRRQLEMNCSSLNITSEVSKQIWQNDRGQNDVPASEHFFPSLASSTLFSITIYQY